MMRYLIILFLVIGNLEVLALALKKDPEQENKKAESKRCHCHKIQKRAEREFRKLVKKQVKTARIRAEIIKKEQKSSKIATFEKKGHKHFSRKKVLFKGWQHPFKNHPRKLKENRISRCTKW